MDREYFSELKSEKDSIFFVKTLFRGDSIDFLIVDPPDAYSGTLRGSKKDEFARNLNKPTKTVDEWLNSAFKNKDAGFAFNLEKSSLEVHFTLKRVGTSGLKQLIFKIKLEEIDFQTAQRDFCSASVKTIDRLRNRGEESSEGFSKLKDDLKRCKAALEEFKNAKENNEKELYERFLPILRSKQDKNKALLRELEELKKPGAAVKLVPDKDYGSDTDIDSDNDEKPKEKRAKKKFF